MIRFSRPLVAGTLTLLAGAVASGVAALWQTQRNANEAQVRFDRLADDVVHRVEERFSRYEYGLRGVRGVVVAAGGRTTRTGFRRYSVTRDVDEEFPGARGFGLIWRVPQAKEADFVTNAQSDGWPAFSIRELEPNQGERFVIQYIEPVERNRAAVGLDVASERNRREAALAAARTGSATLTEPITLVQAAGQPARSFLLLLPIYDTGAQPTSAAQREAATIGWSYAPLVIDEVLKNLDRESGLYTLSIRDTAAADDRPFYNLAGGEHANSPGPHRQLPVEIFGRKWEVDVRATAGFERSLHQTPPARAAANVALIGALCAALAAVLTQLAVRAGLQRVEQARRAAIVAASEDAIVSATLDGVITDWNAGAERMFGHQATEAVGRTVVELLLPGDRIEEETKLVTAARRRERLAPFDTKRRTSTGELIDVSISSAPILAASGECIGYSKTIRDVRESKRDRENLATLNATLEAQVTERTAKLDSAMHDLRAILDAVPSMIGYWDRNLINGMANRAYAKWFDVDPATLPGKSMQELLGADLFERNRPFVEAALSGEAQTFERAIPRSDGSGVRHSLAHYLPDIVDGEVRGFYVLVHDVTELQEGRQRLAAALRDNEALLSTIHEQFIVSVADRSGTIVDVNPAFCAISGYAREELIGQNHRIVNSGEQGHAMWENMWRTVAAGKSWKGDVCNRAKDGSLYWVRSVIAPLLGSDGRIDKYISIRSEITPTKRAQAEAERARRDAEAAQQFLRDLTDRLPMRIAYIDDQLRYQFINDAACLRLGLKREQILGRTREQIVEASVNAATREHFDRALQGVKVTYEIDEKGRTFDVRLVPDHGHDGRINGLFAVSSDITERKQSEVEMRRLLTLLKSVLEASTQVSIIAVETDGRVSLFNRGAEQLLGYSAEEVVGHETFLLFHDREEMRLRAQEMTQRLGRVVHTGMALVEPEVLNQPREWTYKHRDGKRIPVSLAVTAVRDDLGVLVGYLGVAHDISERISYEASLRHAVRKAESANLAKSQFLANMSHEIRTPMNAVIGLSYLLQRTPLDPEQADMLAKIKSASQLLLAIINDVLDLSKIEAAEMHIERAPFRLDALLGELAGLFQSQASAKGIEFKQEVATDLPKVVEGDATRLRQVLTNLLSNAFKFTVRGGVQLSARTMRAEDDVTWIQFEVKDSGVGIEQDVIPKLFSPFVQADTTTTRRFGGTGLGLSIVKQLVSLMGGRIGVDSTPGLGSRFWVEVGLSVSQDTSVEYQGPSQLAASSASLQGMRVLVTDDSSINLEVARRILQSEGAQVSVASNGQEAVDWLLADPEGADVVLMDVQMPVLDGHDATRRIRSGLGLAQLPIIALTAGITTGEYERARAAGMNDVVAKPFDPPDLILAIRRHLPAAALGEATSAPKSPTHSHDWPEIEGIDTRDVRSRLGSDIDLFRSMLRRLVSEFSDLGEPAAHVDGKALAGRLHNLKGSAGTLGAKLIERLAADAEQACVSNDARRLDSLARKLGAEIVNLGARASSILQVDDDAYEPPRGHLDSQALADLVQQLQQFDLAAIDGFKILAPHLRALLGAEAFARIKEQIDELRFTEAALALSVVVS